MAATSFSDPPTDLENVLDSEIKCVVSQLIGHIVGQLTRFCLSESGTSVRVELWSSCRTDYSDSTDIYFKQRNADEHHSALQLRDAVLRLRRDGAFVAVPLFRVNTEPAGPHPVGEFLIPFGFSARNTDRLSVRIV
jgi:hypothetical protein